jgi:hypothetical protein
LAVTNASGLVVRETPRNRNVRSVVVRGGGEGVGGAGGQALAARPARHYRVGGQRLATSADHPTPSPPPAAHVPSVGGFRAFAASRMRSTTCRRLHARSFG